MNPLLDQILVAALILAALGFFARRLLGRNKKGCGSGCCPSPKPPPDKPLGKP